MTYTKHRDTDDVLEVLDSLEIDGHDPDVLSDENIYAKFKASYNHTFVTKSLIGEGEWVIVNETRRYFIAKIYFI